VANDDLVARIAAWTGGTRGLVCANCGRRSWGKARGWQALLGYTLREDEFPHAFVFCPECAEGEFGG